MKRKNKDFTDELAEMLPPERAARAKKNAEKEIFQIRLGIGDIQKNEKKFEKGIDNLMPMQYI